MKHKHHILIFIGILTASIILAQMLAMRGAQGATFTVTNANDSGAGSLRQAILDAAGSSGIDTIDFNIAGGGVKKIAPLTPLPEILGAVIIDGTTQPGWSVGNLVIELSGENLTGATARGLQFFSIPASAPRSFVRGLAINRFVDAGIYIQDSDEITIEGCFIGTDATGTIDRGNKNGIVMRVGSSNTLNITIGGNTAAERNVISGNTKGIDVFGGESIFIKGNYIGTDVTGASPLPNSTGIQFRTFTGTIGGATAAEGNVISGNTSTAVVLDSANHTVQNNYIGVATDGFTPLGNGSDGIRIINSINLVDTGNHLVTGNIIANNRAEGIEVLPNFNNPVGNKITTNSIYNNDNGFGAVELGIDLDGDGVTPNDAGDADSGTNNLQNYPVLTSAVVGATTTNIQGTFNSQANVSYRVEFFANTTNAPEGKTFFGFQNVTTDASGNATINFIASAVAYHGDYVTATATRNTTPFDTSEFSVPIPATIASFVVTNANNSGAGSLRQAILDANASTDPNLITFAITPFDGSVKTINLTSPLPAVSNPVAIDGLTQDSANCDAPKVELNGTGAGVSGDGLTVNADNVLIQGFIINRFSGDGIVLDSNSTNTIRCNKIGTNAAGSAASANGANGILLDTSSSNLIEKNTISANGVSGIRGLFPQFNTIQGNIVGLSSDGTTTLPNVSGGIVFLGGLSNVVGGTTASKRNVVSGNGLVGMVLSNSASNNVQGNYIGVDTNGSGTTFGNNGPGILLSTSFADDNTIGGTETGAGNIIAFNTTGGVSFISTAGTGNKILGNSIHDNGNLGIDIDADGITANDLGDADTGANSRQNFPIITTAESFFGGLKITGSLNSTANTSFRIEVYSNPICDGLGNGEGQTFVGAFEAITNNSGNSTFSLTLTGVAVPIGHFVTATATRNTAPFDTSEYSACRATTALTITTFTVTNTNPRNAGSLRAAINDANADPDPNLIVFNIAGSGVKTISIDTPFPEITEPVIIDGLSQPGASCANPLIELDGTNAGAGADGLLISGSAQIRGLIINRFNGDGIEFTTNGNNSVKCCRIGVTADGLSPARNGRNGLYFNEVSNNIVGGTDSDGNLISCNSSLETLFDDGGIQFFLSNNNVIQGNIIGLDKNGLASTLFLNNHQQHAVTLINSDNNLIGGTTAAARNVLSGHQFSAVSLQNSDQNFIKGNYIGVEITGDISGAFPAFNGTGISLSNANENQIGGTESGAGNVISGNNIRGVGITDSLDIVIEGNLIGTDAMGTGLPGSTNQGDGIVVGHSTVRIGGRTPAARNIISGNQRGIWITSSSTQGVFSAVVEGNYIGLGSDGTTFITNTGPGILIEGFANGNTIGGGAAGAGNVLAGTVQRIAIDSSNNLVQGNLIGTDATGTLDKSTFGAGIHLLANATNNLIGGSSASMRNVISGNDNNGILSEPGADGNIIQNNLIGTAINGTSALGNSLGISLQSSNNSISNNTIAFNGGQGVLISSATGNRISANSIFSNGTISLHLGIDLSPLGLTANDNLDPDTGANNLQNFPIISSAETFPGAGTIINGTLNSSANTSFRIEFFTNPNCDASGNGEGATFLGFVDVTTNASGNATINQTLPTDTTVGQVMTATATRNTAPLDTSEFSACRAITLFDPPAIVVTNTNDSGTGSLRQAIITANGDVVPDDIIFNIPGAGVQTISPASALPTITQPVVIDGLTQPGAACNSPLIELNGTNAGAGADGLNVSAGNSTIQGLVINRFGGDGIELNTNGTNSVQCSRIGTNQAGLGALANGANGIFLNNVSNNTIGGTANDGNLISGNTANGILIDGATAATNNVIRGNLIGVTSSGNAAAGIGNSQDGSHIQGANATNNTIGGTVSGAKNVISNNGDDGVETTNSASNTIIKGNFIGVNASGNVGAGNVDRGIVASGTTTIGGRNTADRNVISANVVGIQTIGLSATTTIQGNYIGLGADGNTPLGNMFGAVLNNTNNCLIGGTTAGAGNVISANTDTGISLDGSNNNVQGNLVGTDATGTLDRGNGDGNVATGSGISVGDQNNTIGGSDAASRNVISGNNFGILIRLTLASNTVIRNNFIGTNAAGTGALGNSQTGIQIASDNNVIGGSPSEGNLIAFSGRSGISLNPTATGNRITSNSIHSNSRLGIDLGNDDLVAANDNLDPDTGANNLQNYPVITSSTTNGATSINIRGNLNSAANDSFTVDFFSNASCDQSGNGQGESYIGSTNVMTNGSGNSPFNVTFNVAVPQGRTITATATDSANNTSEFSACAAPTAVDFLAAEARAYDDGVLLEWQTGMEVNNLGFNLYRNEDGKQTRINEQIIAGSALKAGEGIAVRSGFTYEWWDSGIADCGSPIADCPKISYWIEDRDINGQSNWHGPLYPTPGSEKRPASIQQAKTLAALSVNESPSVPTESLARLPGSSVSSGALKFTATVPTPESSTAITLGVRREGWYRLSQAELLGAGLSKSTDPRLIQLFVDGKQQPIIVNGQDDGLFDPSDSIEFYGTGIDSPFSDVRTYYLVEGKQPGQRVSQVKSFAPAQPGGSFACTVERRERSIYFAALLNGERENFFGSVIASQPVNQPLTLQHVDLNSYSPALLRVVLQGVTNVNHVVTIEINGSFAGVLGFAGQASGETSISIPHSLLREGSNVVRLIPQGGPSDVSLVDTVQLTYQHSFIADDNSLRFKVNGGQPVTIEGFTDAAIRVFDVTDPYSVKEIIGAIEKQGDKQGGSAVSVAFQAAGEGVRTLLALTDARAKHPDRVFADNQSNLRNTVQDAALIIVTHRDFLDQASSLKSYRQSQGLSAAVVDIEDIYDEFSFGQKTPQAIRDFLLFVNRNWRTRYALLFGDASFDPKNYLGLGNTDLVPGRLVDTLFMETGSDDWLADFDQDGIADFAIGRLPARSPAEAQTMIDKIYTYEATRSSNEAVLVSDQSEGFELTNSRLIPLLPQGTNATHLKRALLGDVATKVALIDAINRGQKVVSYAGHGNASAWRGDTLTAADARALQNGKQLPIFVILNCLNGYFLDPATESLAEALMRNASGGDVATWASSAMTFAEAQESMGQEFYRQVFSSRARIGDAAIRAKAMTPDADVRKTWILFGDPTMRMN